MRIYPINGNRSAERTTLTLARLARETSNDKIAVILDNARFHHAKAVTDSYVPGQAREHIAPMPSATTSRARQLHHPKET